MTPRRITARYYQVRANVTLVSEQVLFEHCHDGDDARFAACGEGVQFEIRGHEGGGELGVSGCARAGAPDLGGDVVEFFAVLHERSERGLAKFLFPHACMSSFRGRWTYLISNYRPTRRTRICCNDNTAIVDAADDCCAGGGCFRERNTLGVEGEVSVVVAEVEAGHLCYLLSVV